MHERILVLLKVQKSKNSAYLVNINTEFFNGYKEHYCTDGWTLIHNSKYYEHPSLEVYPFYH